MYERYWKLERPAFESDFEVGAYFPSRSHQGSLLKLRFCLEHRKGIALLVGDHGVGKTYLSHVLEQELDSALRPFVRLVFPQLSPTDMLGYLAMRLAATPGPGVHRPSQDQILRSLEARLESLAADRAEFDDANRAHLLEGVSAHPADSAGSFAGDDRTQSHPAA